MQACRVSKPARAVAEQDEPGQVQLLHRCTDCPHLHSNHNSALALAGKSSFTVAMLRLADRIDGLISIDGVDTATISRQALRRGIALIPQDATMFAGSVRLNLDPLAEHNEAELWAARGVDGGDPAIFATGRASYKYTTYIIGTDGSGPKSDDRPVCLAGAGQCRARWGGATGHHNLLDYTPILEASQYENGEAAIGLQLLRSRLGAGSWWAGRGGRRGGGELVSGTTPAPLHSQGTAPALPGSCCQPLLPAVESSVTDTMVLRLCCV